MSYHPQTFGRFSTYTDSKIEKDVQGTVGERRPRALVCDIGTSNSVEGCTIELPLDRLLRPVGVGAINSHTPSVEAAVSRQCGGRLLSQGLDTGTADARAAVEGTVRGRHSIYLLENVNLSGERPLGAVADGIAQAPEGGPETLLIHLSIGAQEDARLNDHDFSVLGCPRADRLDTARGPDASGALSGDKLDRLSPADLKVVVGSGVCLDLGVGVNGCGNVPYTGVWRGTSRSSKRFREQNAKSIHGGSCNGRGQSRKKWQHRTRCEAHFVYCSVVRKKLIFFMVFDRSCESSRVRCVDIEGRSSRVRCFDRR